MPLTCTNSKDCLACYIVSDQACRVIYECNAQGAVTGWSCHLALLDHQILSNEHGSHGTCGSLMLIHLSLLNLCPMLMLMSCICAVLVHLKAIGAVHSMHLTCLHLQVYLHHIFGPGGLVTGEGAEFRGGYDNPPLIAPYYSVVNGSHFTSNMSRLAIANVCVRAICMCPQPVVLIQRGRRKHKCLCSCLTFHSHTASTNSAGVGAPNAKAMSCMLQFLGITLLLACNNQSSVPGLTCPGSLWQCSKAITWFEQYSIMLTLTCKTHHVDGQIIQMPRKLKCLQLVGFLQGGEHTCD